MAKSIGNCYCLVFLPSIAQSFILEITLAYILQYYTGSPHIVRNSGRKFWLNFGSALAFEWSLKSHEAIYCSNPFEIFSLEISKVSKVSYLSRFLNQKVWKWHWLIFTPFGALVNALLLFHYEMIKGNKKFLKKLFPLTTT